MKTSDERAVDDAAETSAADRSSLSCLFADLVSAPRSTWFARVVDARSSHQDRNRPYVARLFLLVSLIIASAAVGFPWFGWLFFIPGALQVALEIYLEPIMRHRYEAVALRSSTGRDGRRMWYWRTVRVWYRNYEKFLPNVTSALGVVACSIQLALVLFFLEPPTPDRGWVKVLALATAMMYLVSGGLGPLMGPATYSPSNGLPTPVLRSIRLLWIPIPLLLAVIIVARPGAWGETLPYALMSLGLGYYVGLRQREFDRAVTAAAIVRDELNDENLKTTALEYHALTQPVKGSLQEAARRVPNPMTRMELEHYIANVDFIHEQAQRGRLDPRRGLLPPIEELLRREAQNGAVHLDTNIRLDAELDSQHHQMAAAYLRTFVSNSVQAYASLKPDEFGHVLATARQEGQNLVVEVRDTLPLIPDVVLAKAHTLGGIRRHLSAVGGSLIQEPMPNGKVLRATWPITVPLRHPEPRSRS